MPPLSTFNIYVQTSPLRCFHYHVLPQPVALLCVHQCSPYGTSSPIFTKLAHLMLLSLVLRQTTTRLSLPFTPCPNYSNSCHVEQNFPRNLGLLLSTIIIGLFVSHHPHACTNPRCRPSYHQNHHQRTGLHSSG